MQEVAQFNSTSVLSKGKAAWRRFREVVVGLLYSDEYRNDNCRPHDGEDNGQQKREDEPQCDMAELIGEPGIGQGRRVLRVFATE